MYRIRDRIRRWRLPGIEAKIGEVVFQRLAELNVLVAPRVQSACFSTIWNRWCTPRRFQNRDSKSNVCLLGCGGLAVDSIEHYARCRSVRTVASDFLRWGRCLTVDIDHFMLASEALRDDPDILICVAVLIYSTYNSTNHLRFKGVVPLPFKDATELLKQNCRNSVMGHSGSAKVVDGRWCGGDMVRARRS